MSLSDINDIEFVSYDKAEVISNMLALYSEITGRTLAQGDPVRLFIYTIAEIVIQQLAYINYTGKQNLLKYATGDNLDHLGALVGVERIAATAASTTILITLSEERTNGVTVPAGTRVTAGDNVFFAIDEDTVIAAGELTAEASAHCTETGETGNGYLAGELKTIVDPVAYVESMVNTTESAGGAAEEDDESYREAIYTAPEKYSCAGPYGAYEYYAKRASSLITDVAVTTPEPGAVEIRPLLEGGELPTEEIIDLVYETCNDTTIRPLTDNVSVLVPDTVSYNIDVTYYINEGDSTQAATIQAAAEAAVEEYALWQRTTLGRDINPSKLIALIMAAGAKRVEVREPEYTVVAETAVALADSINTELGGIEDE